MCTTPKVGPTLTVGIEFELAGGRSAVKRGLAAFESAGLCYDGRDHSVWQEICTPILRGAGFFGGLVALQSLLASGHIGRRVGCGGTLDVGGHVHVGVREEWLPALLRVASRLQWQLQDMFPFRRYSSTYQGYVDCLDGLTGEALRSRLSRFGRTQINLSAFVKHGTVEFRIFPSTRSMALAAIFGLTAEAIVHMAAAFSSDPTDIDELGHFSLVEAMAFSPNHARELVTFWSEVGPINEVDLEGRTPSFAVSLAESLFPGHGLWSEGQLMATFPVEEWWPAGDRRNRVSLERKTPKGQNQGQATLDFDPQTAARLWCAEFRRDLAVELDLGGNLSFSQNGVYIATVSSPDSREDLFRELHHQLYLLNQSQVVDLAWRELERAGVAAHFRVIPWTGPDGTLFVCVVPTGRPDDSDDAFSIQVGRDCGFEIRRWVADSVGMWWAAQPVAGALDRLNQLFNDADITVSLTGSRVGFARYGLYLGGFDLTGLTPEQVYERGVAFMANTSLPYSIALGEGAPVFLDRRCSAGERLAQMVAALDEIRALPYEVRRELAVSVTAAGSVWVEGPEGQSIGFVNGGDDLEEFQDQLLDELL